MLLQPSDRLLVYDGPDPITAMLWAGLALLVLAVWCGGCLVTAWWKRRKHGN